MANRIQATEAEDIILNQVKEHNKTPGFVYLLTAMAAIGGFLFGYDTGVISGAMVIIKDEFGLDTLWQELIVSVTIGAAALFAAIGGVVNDRLGRKAIIIFASLVFTVGAVVMGTATDKKLLLCGRFIVGAGIGLVSMTVPMYLAETAPTHLRGRLVTVNQVFITGGQLVASVVDGIFSYDKKNGWRYMLGLAGVPSAVQFLGFLFMPESPRWLVQQCRYDEAVSALRKVRPPGHDVDEEFQQIRTAYIDGERDRAEHAGGLPVIVQMLKTASLRRALVIGCGLQMFQQVSGINTVMYYSATIIEMSGVRSKSEAIWLAAATAAVNFLCTFIGLALIERVGRRRLVLASLVGVFCSLIVLGVGFQLESTTSPHISVHELVNRSADLGCSALDTCYTCTQDERCGYCFDTGNGSCLAASPTHPSSRSWTGRCENGSSADDNNNKSSGSLTWAFDWCPYPYNYLPILGLALYLFFFAPGMGPVPWVVNSEIYPHWARSTGNSAATFTNWVFNLIVSLTFLTLTERLTRHGAFYLYAGLTMCAYTFVLLLMPETRGLSLEQVEGLFARPWISGSLTPGGAPSAGGARDRHQYRQVNTAEYELLPNE